MKHILLFFNDVQQYPPLITVIDVLLKNNHDVILLGYCSNLQTINSLKAKGLVYHEIINIKNNASSIHKFIEIIKFKKNAEKLVHSLADNHTKLWFFGNRVCWVLNQLVKQYDSIVYLFETPELKVLKRFKLISPRVNYFETMRNANKVVCCEDNRAAITQSYFQLKDLPSVIPNKPNIHIEDIKPLADSFPDIYQLLIDKKIILYQGIFNYPERKLEELCLAIDLLPKEFELVCMGGDSKYKRQLESKYSNSRIHFLNYIPSPLHLSVTKLSYIGFLSYHAGEGDIVNSLNTLYCAPNKVYEFTLFGKPMLSSFSPALERIYEKYGIGLTVRKFEPDEIAKAVLRIDKNYNSYTHNCSKFYDDCNIEHLILSVTHNC